MSLERRYRMLLLAYPRPFRRGHAVEMVTTLLEMAAPGQSRPGASDAWHLVVSGLRQRFRLPSGRPLVWVAAVLVTLIGGAFGAAAGSWAAERTFTDLPADAGVTELARQVAGGSGEVGQDRSASPWTTTMVVAGTDQPGWTAEAATRRLAADGWTVGAVSSRSGTAVTFDPATGAQFEVPLSGSAFEARRDGLLMTVTGHVTPGGAPSGGASPGGSPGGSPNASPGVSSGGSPGGGSSGHGAVSIDLWPADTGAMLPATVGGALAGLVGGWLLAAAGAYRLRGSSPARRRVAAVLTGLAVAALALPAFAFWVNVWRVLRAADPEVFTVHSALNAGPYWSHGTPWMLLELTVAGLVVTAAAWVVLMRRPAVSLLGDHVPTSG
ncbi:hypothetical protein [Actinoplanes sp. URMC 104]|uniref:hypothetical protein n=1 Tax=Actinoplanes sp. URMC 104 TaxID=3423409 RepID=UPI003F1D7888